MDELEHKAGFPTSEDSDAAKAAAMAALEDGEEPEAIPGLSEADGAFEEMEDDK